MWSRKPTPVDAEHSPAPSSASRRRIVVSRVERSISAARGGVVMAIWFPGKRMLRACPPVPPPIRRARGSPPHVRRLPRRARAFAPPPRATLPAPGGAENRLHPTVRRSVPRPPSAARDWSPPRSRRRPRHRRRRRTRSHWSAPARRAAPRSRRPARGARVRTRSRASIAVSRSSVRTSASGASCTDARDPAIAPASRSTSARSACARRGDRHERVGPVLRLSGDVQRDDARVGIRVGDHQQLAGAGDAVDAHTSHDLALRLLHERVARSHDHVHRCHVAVP